MLEIRPLTLEDNLEDVSELIYITDPYIYPYWLENVDRAKTLLPYIIKRKTVYNYENIIIALIDNSIAGFICYMDTFPTDNYQEMLLAYQDANERIDQRFDKVNNEYFEHLNVEFEGRYITCCAVLEKYRERGVASAMLKYFDNMTLELAAVKDNYVALALYEKSGFKIIYDYPGFTGVPCVEMMKK